MYVCMYVRVTGAGTLGRVPLLSVFRSVFVGRFPMNMDIVPLGIWTLEIGVKHKMPIF
jgi:hypothetical protein